MRSALVLTALLLVAATAHGENPQQQSDPIPGLVRLPGSIDLPVMDRGEFYCQLPGGLFGIPAATGLGAEAADEIPSELAGFWIHGIVFWIGEVLPVQDDPWMRDVEWVDPAGVIVNYYAGQCPPGMEPVLTSYVEWDGPFMYRELAYSDPEIIVYGVVVWQCPPVLIEPGMSMGCTVDNGWGDAPPICVVFVTNPGELYGCPAYLDWEAIGAPRWTSVYDLTGLPIDLAFCLIEDMGPSAAEGSTWGALKELYR